MKITTDKNHFAIIISRLTLSLLGLVFFTISAFTQPTVTARLANPVYDCVNEEYCLDVQFQSDVASEELFGMNVRFFYDDGLLEFLEFRNFAGGYGPVAPNPAEVTTGTTGSGFSLFAFDEGDAEFVNGAIQLTNQAAPDIILPSDGSTWVTLFQMCFTVETAGLTLTDFCPAVVWDLEYDPADGGFLIGDDGVVITVVDPDPGNDSNPAFEQVDQFNWEYDPFPSSPQTPPYGFLDPVVCVNTECIPALTVIKTDNDADGYYSAGDVIDYDIIVENTGALRIDGVTLVDPNADPGSLSCTSLLPVASLLPGESIACTATHTITQAEIDAGLVQNVATASGIDQNGDPIVDASDDPNDVNNIADPGADTTITIIIQEPELQMEKTGVIIDNLPVGIQPGGGDIVAYTIIVTNTGNVTVNGISISDPNADPGSISCSTAQPFTLLPGASLSCTAEHTITQTDIDNGLAINTATVTGLDPNGSAVTDISDDPNDQDNVDPEGDGEPDDPTEVPIPQDLQLELEKEGTLNDGGDGIVNPGDIIEYTFTVTNTGNTFLQNISITDADVTGLACIPAQPFSLTPGTSVTCTAVHVITQDEINTGEIVNVAVVNGEDLQGDPVSDLSDDPTDPTNIDTEGDGDPDDPTVTPITKVYGLEITNDDGIDPINEPLVAVVGDLITYDFVITNTGNVTVSGINVIDLNIDGGSLTCNGFSILPGATILCQATHTITQADIDAGVVINTATVEGLGLGGVPVTDVSDDPDDPTDIDPELDGEPDDPTPTPLLQTPELQAEKTDVLNLGGDGIASAGDIITYDFLVTNTGNVTIDNVSVTDPLADPGSISCPSTTLAPGASMNCTAIHTVTQADVNVGLVENIATVTGLDPAGNTVSDLSDDPDDTVDFLNPDDLDYLGLADTEPDDTTNTLLPQFPELQLTKVDALIDGGDGVQPGDPINYTFVITNTGNVTINNITLTDPDVASLACLPAQPFGLEPGISVTCNGTYVVTQADIDAGSYTNVAVVSGFDPNGDPVTDESDDPDDPANFDNEGDGEPDDPTDTSLPQTPELQVVKEDNLDTGLDGFLNAGDVINYNIIVTNTGNVTIDNIAVSDPNADPGSIVCPATTLSPGTSMVCVAIHTVTQTDIDNGVVVNTATAAGDDPNGDPVVDNSDDPDDPTDSDPDNDGEPDDPTVTDLPQISELQIEKDDALELGLDGIANVGDIINYTFTVSNKGNVTIDNIFVSDPNANVGSVSCPAMTLLPGISMICTATHTLTQADVNAGVVINTATANGTDPGGDPVSDLSDDPDEATDVDPEGDGEPDDPTVTLIPQLPELQVTKVDALDNGADGIMDPGDVINYTITVANTGNVTVSNVLLTDPNADPGSISCPTTTLLPGASMVCTAKHTVTQGDLDAGLVLNTATASGADPNGDPVIDESDDPDDLTETDPDGDGEPDDPTSTPLPQIAELQIEKTDALDLGIDGVPTVGDIITYSFTVINNGNVTISGITINDPDVSGLSCLPVAPFILAPGASATCSGIYLLTQADIDDGVHVNSAIVEGLDPNANPVQDISDDPDDPTDFENPVDLVNGVTDTDPDDTTKTTLPQFPAIEVQKTDVLNLGTDGIANRGDTIFYSISVTNTGNVTIDNIVISDPNALPGSLSCPATSLTPGASMTCAAIDTLTQADVDAGIVVNVASADGTDPNGGPVSDNSDDPDDPTDADPDNDGDPDDPTVTSIPQDPNLDVLKDDGLTSPLVGAAAGDQITYTVTVTNNGTVTVDNIALVDILPSASVGALSDNAADDIGLNVVIAPGDSEVATVTYNLTQADIDAGFVENLITANGVDPNGLPVIDNSDDPDDQTNNDPDSDGDYEDSTVTPLEQDPGLEVLKDDASVTDNGDGIDSEGDVINYDITVTNTGNVTISGITIIDANADQGSVSCLAVEPFSLAPGQTVSCTATHTVTLADMNAGVTVNTAFASGQDPNGNSVIDTSDDPSDPDNVDTEGDGEPDDPTETSLNQLSKIQVDKVDVLDLGPNNAAEPGDMINYTITVYNTGTVSVSDIEVMDMGIDEGSLSCPLAPLNLDPGESFSCTASYTLTAADITAKFYINTASADGTGPQGNPAQDISDDPDDPTDTEADAVPDGEGDDPTETLLPCIDIQAWVFLEGSGIANDGSSTYPHLAADTMRTDLNDLRILPGQTLVDPFFGNFYTPVGQPYIAAPWNYPGTEGDLYDSENLALGQGVEAGYPSTVTDWVLVSLRDTPDGDNEPFCQAAALLHNDGSIEFVEGFTCCEVDLEQDYYLVIEHRDHLIVMSDVPVDISDQALVYDFRVQQSYVDDPFGFGTFSQQKEVLAGIFAMFGGNSQVAATSNADTDINFDDRTFWEGENGIIARYRSGDHNMNGDTNFNDRILWENNNGRFTSVPRN